MLANPVTASYSGGTTVPATTSDLQLDKLEMWWYGFQPSIKSNLIEDAQNKLARGVCLPVRTPNTTVTTTTLTANVLQNFQINANGNFQKLVIQIVANDPSAIAGQEFIEYIMPLQCTVKTAGGTALDQNLIPAEIFDAENIIHNADTTYVQQTNQLLYKFNWSDNREAERHNVVSGGVYMNGNWSIDLVPPISGTAIVRFIFFRYGEVDMNISEARLDTK